MIKEIKAFRRLATLYIQYYFTKVTLIILLSSFLLLLIFLILMSGFQFTEYEYIINKDLYIRTYFNSSLFFLNIFDAVFITYLLGFEANRNVVKFDMLFTADNSRGTIFRAKIFAFLLLIILFLIGEYLILFFVPAFVYPTFIFKMEYYRLLLYQFVQSVFLFLFGMLWVLFLRNIFVSLIAFLYFFITKILCEDGNLVGQVTNFLFPHLIIHTDLSVSFRYGMIYPINLIIVLYLLDSFFFSMKDLN